jgi:hypothetical protein
MLTYPLYTYIYKNTEEIVNNSICYLQTENFTTVLLTNHFVRLPPENCILSPKRNLSLDYEEPFSVNGTLFFVDRAGNTIWNGTMSILQPRRTAARCGKKAWET